MPGIPLLNREFRPRNAQIVPRYLDDLDGGDIYEKDGRFPKKEQGKYLSRPEVPDVYKQIYPEFFDPGRVPPMFHPYLGDPEMLLARHFRGQPTLPVPALAGEELEYKARQPTAEAQETAEFCENRILFGAGMPWWKWKIICDKPMDMPTKASFREHECGHATFRGKLRDNLPYANMDGWAMAKSAETLLDLSANDGLSIPVRGDGKKYHCILTSANTEHGSIEYVAEISAKPSANKWRVLELKWSNFVPCFRGGKYAGLQVHQVPPVDPSAITSIGFGVGDRQWGTFVLEIEHIKACCF